MSGNKMKFEDILFSQGFGTRYDCRAIILSGAISIAGTVVDNPDARIDTEGLVFTYREEDWPYFEKAIIALNKPAGYECSMKPSCHPSVMTLLPSPLRKRNMQPVGRLDVDTTGLLLFTDDGALQHRLIHPKRHVEKVYVVTTKHPISRDMCNRLLQGVILDDCPKPVKAKAVVQLDEYHLTMTLTEGKYHQVKRMIAACSNRVEQLHRSTFGKYCLSTSLPEGQWVWLRKRDIL